MLQIRRKGKKGLAKADIYSPVARAALRSGKAPVPEKAVRPGAVAAVLLAAGQTARTVPGERLSVYEGIGHAPFFEDARRFNAELVRQLAGRRGGPEAPPGR